jgi:hypothetical protein
MSPTPKSGSCGESGEKREEKKREERDKESGLHACKFPLLTLSGTKLP